MTRTRGRYTFVGRGGQHGYGVYLGPCYLGDLWRYSDHGDYTIRDRTGAVILSQRHTLASAARSLHCQNVRNVAQFFTRGIFILGREGIA